MQHQTSEGCTLADRRPLTTGKPPLAHHPMGVSASLQVLATLAKKKDMLACTLLDCPDSYP